MDVYIGKVCGYGEKEFLGTVDVEIMSMEEKESIFRHLSVLQPYAGKKHGFYTLPQKDDLVLVMFLSNALKRAVVLGSLHRSDDDFYKKVKAENEDLYWITPKENKIHFHEKDKKISLEILMKNGSGMIFDDEKDEIKLFTKENKNEVDIDGKEGELYIKIEKKIVLECGKSKIMMEKNGNIKMEGEKIQINGKDLDLKGKNKTQISAQQLQLEAKSKAVLASSGTTEVKAQGSTKIGGAQISLK